MPAKPKYAAKAHMTDTVGQPTLLGSEGEEAEADIMRIPLAIDSMCGPTTPISKALQWRGWRVHSWDLRLDASHDLSKAKGQEDVMQDVPMVDFCMSAMAFSTLTRARNKPIPNHPKPPQPLRSDDYPMGLPEAIDCPTHDQHTRALPANGLVQFLCRVASVVDANGGFNLLEHLARAYMWMLEVVKELASQQG